VFFWAQNAASDSPATIAVYPPSPSPVAESSTAASPAASITTRATNAGSGSEGSRPTWGRKTGCRLRFMVPKSVLEIDSTMVRVKKKWREYTCNNAPGRC
jgi:hypothetical protein